MNFLDIDKGGKFQLFFSKSDERRLHLLPTCRYRPNSESMSLQPQVEVWKALNPLIETGLIQVSDKAYDLLIKLKKSYVIHRRSVKTASIKFKGKTVDYIPVPLKSTPYCHQVRAFGFSSHIDSTALLMEQGTGKTLVAIAVAAQRFLNKQIKRVMVICPKSVIPVWPKELRKHLDIKYVWDKPPKSSNTPLKFPKCKGVEFFIINYDKIKPRIKELLKWKPDMVILDESHRIKSDKAQRTKTCYKIGDQVRFKLILTGTVLGQSPVDAWSQYRFLNGNIFGRSFADFKELYCVKGGYQGYQVVGYKNLKDFSTKLHSIAFRCTKKECLDLPDETSQNIYCEPSDKTLKIYKELNVDLSTVINNEELDVDLAITKIIKLRQITGGLVKKGEDKLLNVSQEKLLVLEDLLINKNWDSGKIVIATSFTHEVEIISTLCEKLKIRYITLTGETSEEGRFTIEKRFSKNSSNKVLILQVSTGGEGLDFTSADMLVFYSPTFSFIQVSQVKARIHRIGQDKPVTYLYIVMEGTVDEDIVKFLEQHGDLTDTILEENRSYKLYSDEIMNNEIEFKNSLKKISREIDKLSKGSTKKLLRKKKMIKKTKPKMIKEEVKPTPNEYTVSMMAEELDVDVPKLRILLNESGVEKPGGRWKWSRKKDYNFAMKIVKAFVRAEAKEKKQKDKEKKALSKEKVKKVTGKKPVKRVVIKKPVKKIVGSKGKKRKTK